MKPSYDQKKKNFNVSRETIISKRQEEEKASRSRWFMLQ